MISVLYRVSVKNSPASNLIYKIYHKTPVLLPFFLRFKRGIFMKYICDNFFIYTSVEFELDKKMKVLISRYIGLTHLLLNFPYFFYNLGLYKAISLIRTKN